jgi:2-aminoadipate transaminase
MILQHLLFTGNAMQPIIADRLRDVPRSFIREILKVTLDNEVISFAGGLPNRAFFPVEALKEATMRVYDEQGADVLQYGNSEGLLPLREIIAARYKSSAGIEISPENILITNGSQQGLDLIAKTLLNEGDGLILEEPGYLGAIQAFSIYRPRFLPVPVGDEGMNTERLKEALGGKHSPRLIYTVPNFQNPSGISYSEENRREIARLLAASGTLLIEDNPYGELRFKGSPVSSFGTLLPKQTILLGSFSKVVTPGFRLGWIAAPPALTEKLLIAKQASDLHTTHFTQAIICRYLEENDLDSHVATISEAYGRQCRAMQACIARHFPAGVECTDPEGGMFLWARLPEKLAALDLFEAAAKEKVVFVPGDPFYIDRTRVNTMRLNFSCVDEEAIERGIAILGKTMKSLL